ncbi:glycosyltransferase family 4 protein [Ferrimonas balearica]|uniref:glycosyltransferase family 4 protein n=1 Tax=Ferrimonas balearica TaxID=44012 RepID=UPI001C995EA4|nr:glycosyltransferase family 4 protein [Ferrimonas balearica]MBY5994262.1 glycosyltransferase family 4 protein [Ferrimonas balearica]
MTKPIKVAWVGGRGYHSSYGGVENAIRQLARATASMPDIDSWVTGRGQGLGFVERQESGLQLVEAPKWLGRMGQGLCTLGLLLYVLVRVRPDTLFLFASGPSLLSFLGRLFGARTVACLRAIDSQRDGWKGLNQQVLKLGEYSATRVAHQCTVNSLAMQRHFAAQGLETVYIPNGITPLEPDRPGFLAQKGLESGRFLLYAGRLDPVKRLDVLLAAHHSLPKESRLPLVVAGGKCKNRAYQAQLEAMAADDVHFLGHLGQQELSTLMRHCALFVLPSVLEGMSNSLLTAMGAGRCVLCADVPENADVVSGDPRVLFEADNVEALRGKLTEYLQHPPYRDEVALAMKTLSQQFSWQRSAHAFCQLAREGRGYE